MSERHFFSYFFENKFYLKRLKIIGVNFEHLWSQSSKEFIGRLEHFEIYDENKFCYNKTVYLQNYFDYIRHQFPLTLKSFGMDFDERMLNCLRGVIKKSRLDKITLKNYNSKKIMNTNDQWPFDIDELCLFKSKINLGLWLTLLISSKNIGVSKITFRNCRINSKDIEQMEKIEFWVNRDFCMSLPTIRFKRCQMDREKRVNKVNSYYNFYRGSQCAFVWGYYVYAICLLEPMVNYLSGKIIEQLFFSLGLKDEKKQYAYIGAYCAYYKHSKNKEENGSEILNNLKSVIFSDTQERQIVLNKKKKFFQILSGS